MGRRKGYLRVVAQAPTQQWPTARSEADLRQLHPGPDTFAGQPVATLEELERELLESVLDQPPWRLPDYQRDLALMIIVRRGW